MRSTLNLPLYVQEFVKSLQFDAIENGEIVTKVTPIQADRFHLQFDFKLEEAVALDDWQVNLTPTFNPTFHWSPHLTPTDDHIVSQHSFRTPALIVANEDRQIKLIPDLDLMGKSPVKWYLDLDAIKNQLTMGMSEYRVDGHILFVREKGMILPKGQFSFGFYLFVEQDKREIENPFRNILAFLWAKHGKALYQAGEPVDKELKVYVDHTYDWAFNRWEAVYQEFELAGKTVGAPAFIVNVSQSPNFPGIVNEREMRSIWNQAWFSSIRSASGLYRYARRYNQADYLEKAKRAKELALSAPMKEGFFPAVISTEMEHVEIDGHWVNRSKGWETAFWGNSNGNPFKTWGHVKEAPYHILDMSFTALYMLTWYEELEQDERLKDYALTYAKSLIKIQREDGFFPAWLDLETLEPMGVLDDSPETSMSVTFLLKVYKLTKEAVYLQHVKKAMEAVINHVIPEGRWEDFETYWSCSGFGNHQVGQKFERNNLYKQCNFSMFWTAEALLNCYEVMQDERYLTIGQRVLDELLMTQASWQPPYIYVNALGGFGVMNADGEWNDARQSLFAEIIIKYGMITAKDEYIERGIAALKASYVMMYCDENPKVKEQWEKRWPFFNEKDYGFTMENYGHNGFTTNEGIGIGDFTIFDWGNGAAAEAYMRIIDHLDLKI